MSNRDEVALGGQEAKTVYFEVDVYVHVKAWNIGLLLIYACTRLGVANLY